MFKNKILITIFLTVFIDLLGVGILIPVIPQLFANPNSVDYILPLSFPIEKGYLLLGLLIAVFPLGQFIATPILGQLSDKYGRKKILSIALFGTAISYVIFAIAITTKNIPLLFISRFFDGATGGNISIAQAMIGDVSDKDNRARNFGMLGAAFGLGFIFGPYIGGKLSDPSVLSWFDASVPFYFAAILAFVNMMSVIFLVPETNKHLRKEKLTWIKSLTNINRAFRMKGMSVLFMTNFLFFAGFTFFTTFFGVFLINKFSFTQGDIGDFFAYVGLWGVFTQAVLTRIFSKKFTEPKILRYTLLGSGIMILFYFLPKYSWQLLLIPPFFSACTGLTMANVNSLLSKSAPIDQKGEIMGISSSVQALAQVLPAIISGFIAATLSPYTPLVIASVLIIISGLSFRLFYKN